MADLVATAQTTLGSEEVIVRAVQFFTNEKWRPQTQSARIATFQGRPPIPIGSIILMIVFVWTVIVPIIMYINVIRKVIRFQNLVVTANPSKSGADVTITYPKHAAKLVKRFTELLPAATSAAS
jgi:hypothetical protein